jgi:hypothetical protein
MTIFDTNGNAIHVLDATVMNRLGNGDVALHKGNEGELLGILTASGAVVLYGNTKHAIERAGGNPLCNLVKQLKNPDTREDLNKAYLAQLKTLLRDFDSKQMKWKKNLNP